MIIAVSHFHCVLTIYPVVSTCQQIMKRCSSLFLSRMAVKNIGPQHQLCGLYYLVIGGQCLYCWTKRLSGHNLPSCIFTMHYIECRVYLYGGCQFTNTPQ